MTKSHRKLHPFVGVDGEGAGKDRRGRQHYMLFRIGGRELYTGKPLRIEEIFDFILATPTERLLYGYSFGYDASQILRQLPVELLKNGRTGIFDLHPADVFYTYYAGKYGLEYIPGNHFRVCLLEAYTRADGTRGLHAIKGTTRTIFDGFASFKLPFVKALEQFGVGEKHWPALAAMKEKRRSFDRVTPEIRAYCELECDLLAELMTKFRTMTHALELRPQAFNGGGKIATYLHRKHKTPTSGHYKILVHREARAMMADAYFGHRFEAVRIGSIAGPIYEYDQNSAYPAGIPGLPCLTIEHNLRPNPWQKASGGELAQATRDGSLFVARVSFSNPTEAPIGALPVRAESGRLSWPLAGDGVYWSEELRAARRAGCSIELHEGWIYRPRCDCHTFPWVEPLYRERKALGDAGEPLKIGLAALYGKFAQRRHGVGRYHNLMYAGLITARERARVLDLALHDPASVVMFAGDAIFSLKPLPAAIGEGLGEWRQAGVHQSLFIVKPGLHWVPGHPRSKGIPTSIFVPYIPAFEKAWRDWLRAGAAGLFPAVWVQLELFTGLRQAVLSEHPELAGKWSIPNNGKGLQFSFNWNASRGGGDTDGDCVVTRPLSGGVVSAGYDPEKAEAFDLNREIFEEQQDKIDLTLP